ncbi:MAG: efflux transporter outer membrane subunit [Rhodospirillales bacterium]|nr:efflux transporter outer membrane subunit [Rhodospirillales bacterium]
MIRCSDPRRSTLRPAATRRRTFLAGVLGASMLAGCTVGPDFHPPQWHGPTAWGSAAAPKAGPRVASTTSPAEAEAAWWQAFGDPQLSALEAQVAAENLDVRAATLRLAESRAALGIAGADRFPSVGGNASYQRELPSSRGVFSALGSDAAGVQSAGQAASGAPGTSAGGINGAAQQNPIDIYQYGFDASWELDLWGRVRRKVESAQAGVTAAEEARRGALVTALAEVARDYVDLRGTQEEMKIARDNLKTAQESLSLTRARAAGGVTTDLDVANAAAQVETNAAELPSLRAREAREINAISLLLGKPPGALAAELHSARPVPPVPPRVPVGVPSELVRRRPDIREAEAKLHAATADIGVAIGDFYPRVTLSGSLGIQALQPWNLFNLDSRQYAAGPGITVPLFEGGRLRATLHLREAQQAEAALTYQRIVLAAWHEVDNALTAYRSEQQRRDALTKAEVQSNRALSLARERYQQGVADFLQVLDAERSLLRTQQALAISTTAVSTDLVALYKALGGGWEDAFPAASPPAKPPAAGQPSRP